MERFIRQHSVMIEQSSACPLHVGNGTQKMSRWIELESDSVPVSLGIGSLLIREK